MAGKHVFFDSKKNINQDWFTALHHPQKKLCKNFELQFGISGVKPYFSRALWVQPL